MVASKTLAAAIVAFGFSSSALACVNFKGSDASDGSFVVTDGGSMKCSGAIQSGDKDLSMFIHTHQILYHLPPLSSIPLTCEGCVDGYSLNYDWTDNMSVDAGLSPFRTQAATMDGLWFAILTTRLSAVDLI
ncbi:hypothetical protein N7478_008443 [Penicillium angulare]|uniref:uncharacterized protein n=1 Tax=Penicillium angulare TaxID=116970 RepID=UPI0025404B9B|nr:uncharacterized protein N7478_008443 [Penicillium angulare]KAJ5273318.1 hypothetical protein N7478_008443 [Penicillium angulare]